MRRFVRRRSLSTRVATVPSPRLTTAPTSSPYPAYHLVRRVPHEPVVVECVRRRGDVASVVEVLAEDPEIRSGVEEVWSLSAVRSAGAGLVTRTAFNAVMRGSCDPRLDTPAEPAVLILDARITRLVTRPSSPHPEASTSPAGCPRPGQRSPVSRLAAGHLERPACLDDGGWAGVLEFLGPAFASRPPTPPHRARAAH